ncbi:hypothetical protein AWENTII_010786 [Aspergillus wentii]
MESQWAQLEVDTSVKGVLDIVDKNAAEINGKSLKLLIPGMENAEGLHQYDGTEVPW